MIALILLGVFLLVGALTWISAGVFRTDIEKPEHKEHWYNREVKHEWNWRHK